MAKRILLISFIFSAIVISGGFVSAADPILSALPASDSHDVGAVFDVTAQLNAQGVNTCVVKGKLNLENLNCADVTLTQGIMAQKAPSCSDLNFVLGIPRCTIGSQSLFQISVSGENVGTARVSFSGVSVVGVGYRLVFSTEDGVYNINAIEPLPLLQEDLLNEEELSYNEEEGGQVTENGGNGQLLQDQGNGDNNNPYTAGLLSVAKRYIWWLLILLIILIIAYLIYRRMSRDKN